MDGPFVCCYSDTPFRPSVVSALLDCQSEIAISVDTDWLTRYAERTEHPSDDAEKGCADCQPGRIDSVHEIVQRVETTLKDIAPERITLNPDCGFAPGSAAIKSTPSSRTKSLSPGDSERSIAARIRLFRVFGGRRTDLSQRAKKGPRKGRVPGGQRTLYFSGSDWIFAASPQRAGQRAVVNLPRPSCTRSAPHKPPCRRQDASWSAGTNYDARPQMQTRMMETSRPPALALPWAKLRLTHEGARICNFPKRVKGGFWGVEKFRFGP